MDEKLQQPNTYFPVFSLKFLKGYIVHMRPYLLFVSGIAGLTGMSLSGQEMSLGVFLMGFLPFFLGYGFGQALTDCYQIDTDSISSPYRPLVKKEISPQSVKAVSLIGLVGIFSSLSLLNTYNLFFGFLMVVGILTYTYFKKNYWFTGPFYNGWIVMLLPVTGHLAVTGGSPSVLFDSKMFLVAMMTLFSYANFVLIGYLKDIEADRETGYKTFPVVFGWDKSVLIGDIFLIISATIAIFLTNGSFLALALAVIATCVAVSGQTFAHVTHDKSEKNATYPIVCTVRSFILWHSAVILVYKPSWLIFLLCFYAFYELTLDRRPSKEQV